MQDCHKAYSESQHFQNILYFKSGFNFLDKSLRYIGEVF